MKRDRDFKGNVCNLPTSHYINVPPHLQLSGIEQGEGLGQDANVSFEVPVPIQYHSVANEVLIAQARGRFYCS